MRLWCSWVHKIECSQLFKSALHPLSWCSSITCIFHTEYYTQRTGISQSDNVSTWYPYRQKVNIIKSQKKRIRKKNLCYHLVVTAGYAGLTGPVNQMLLLSANSGHFRAISVMSNIRRLLRIPSLMTGNVQLVMAACRPGPVSKMNFWHETEGREQTTRQESKSP